MVLFRFLATLESSGEPPMLVCGGILHRLGTKTKTHSHGNDVIKMEKEIVPNP